MKEFSKVLRINIFKALRALARPIMLRAAPKGANSTILDYHESKLWPLPGWRDVFQPDVAGASSGQARQPVVPSLALRREADRLVCSLVGMGRAGETCGDGVGSGGAGGA